MAMRLARLVVGAGLLLVGTHAVAQVTWVDHVPKLRALPVAVGGRALARTNDRGDASGFGRTSYVYQWPGTHFEAAFAGSEVYFRVGPQNNQVLHVTLDGQPPVVLVKPRMGNYRVQGLGAGPHRVRVEVVTENQVEPSVFHGFAIPAGERSLPAPVRARQMELIGDSHTLGYGNASPKRACSGEEVLLATDVDRTAGVMAADHYGADYRVIAISGRGVMRNYGGSGGDPVPVAYPYALEDKREVYNDARWQPQVVVIALGANDFSPLHAGERWKTTEQVQREFEATYAQFVQTLRGRYPKAYFILWAWSTDTYPAIVASAEHVVARLKSSGETRVQFIPMSGLSMSACDWHPSLADNQLIYSKLVGFLDAHPQLWQGK